MLRPQGVAPYRHVDVGGAAGAGLAVTTSAVNRPGRVAAGDAHLVLTGRVGLGRGADLGVRAFDFGAAVDVGWRVHHGPRLDVFLDPSVAGAAVPAMVCGGLVCVGGVTSGEVLASFPVVLSFPAGTSRFTFSPAFVVSWSPDRPQAVRAPPDLYRTAGVDWNPTLVVALDVPGIQAVHVIVEADASLLPDAGVVVGTLTLGLQSE